MTLRKIHELSRQFCMVYGSPLFTAILRAGSTRPNTIVNLFKQLLVGQLAFFEDRKPLYAVL
jgi:hypothetical protein